MESGSLSIGCQRISHGLAQFDGSYLYEHEDPRQGYHPHWNTLIFNYGRAEVGNFLIASALFWIDKMHVDGLRVDAVASMLYLDYGRKEGEWVPNQYGGHYNLEAIEWMKHLNAIVAELHPGTQMIAEESTAFSGVTHPLHQGGLGFTMKWSLGWMNDSLRYFSKDPIYRSYHQHDLTFFLLYAFSERYVLSLSHDEVVHGKSSLLSKMPGDDWQKFANLRLLYSYQICQVGKKLLFMGAELGQWEEWSLARELPWDLLQHERHEQLHRFFQEMNHFYLGERALWERDFHWEGFEWVDCSDQHNCVLSYLRKGNEEQLLVVHNLTPTTHFHYRLRMPYGGHLREVFNSDEKKYGGSGHCNGVVTVHDSSVELTLAPLATMIFKVLV
jgi:1,4-alpha-glucan branching enzyme